jgi:hypothetical protein
MAGGVPSESNVDIKAVLVGIDQYGDTHRYSIPTFSGATVQVDKIGTCVDPALAQELLEYIGDFTGYIFSAQLSRVIKTR